MPPASAPTPDASTLEAALAAAGLRDIGRLEVLAPWSVARVHLASGEPETVVVKWLREPSGSRPADAAQLHTERAALGFLGERCPGVAPRLLGADPAGEMIVLEDLAPRRSLRELIADDAPGGAAGLTRFARTLGHLHAATVGASATYYRQRRALGPVDPDRERLRFGEPRPHLAELSARLDTPVDERTAADLVAVEAVLAAPGPFLAFSNGDCGANNVFVDEETARIIDFEFAGYRHCLSDVCCLYVPGPQWLTVGEPAEDGTEDAYRARLAEAVREADDDRSYGAGVAASGLTWALLRLGRLALLDERGPGHESRAQMVATLDAAARTASRFGCFPALRGWVRRVEERLRARWPDADLDLGAVPPYSRRGWRPRPGPAGSRS